MIRRIFFFTFSFPVFLFAQRSENDSLLSSFKIAYENDVFTNTDYYYTGGTFLELNAPFLKRNPVSKILLTLPQGTDESFGISVNNLGFTPTSIKSDSILFGDRPFAATLYLGQNRISHNYIKQTRLISELDLGCIGPAAIGYQTQKFIHEHTNNPIPHGWQFQIKNDVYFNYGIKFEKGLWTKNRVMDLIGYGFLNAGTIYDNTGIGLKTRIGRMDNYFSVAGFSNRFQCWLFANGELKLIAYDATMEGGLLNTKSVYTIPQNEIEHATFSFSTGIVLAYKKIRLEYFDSLLTPEFQNGRKHDFGHTGITFIF